ncbi:amidase [Saxibacter everestensis]|uniref:Amidase n=1 Tax=Saxibacter everestensis TaxID=2909229 RepID=A0ABY8QSS7_9MICO|nr:amidase [Brevibacteriaceae bacterium ZFBP1038]
MTIDVFSSARDMLDAVRSRDISAVELLELHRRQIEYVNPKVNALVSIDFERAHEQATAADAATERGAAVGRLHGLPFGFKDTHAVGGWLTTSGSPIFADLVPTRSDLHVQRVQDAGAITVAKTNVPEFAAGSHTFNPVFGLTRNPYDPDRSAGGSSGGSAVALATGMLPLADGSDMGGSLRNPASFNNVVGFRPSPGRVPVWPNPTPWDTLAVAGPMARTVDDLCLLLSVLAGPTSKTELARELPGDTFSPLLPRTLAGARVAFDIDLGGSFAVDNDVRAVIEAQRSVFSDAGAVVEEAHPRLDGADEVFRVLRAWLFQLRLGDLLARHPGRMKDSLVQNIQAGVGLTGEQLGRALTSKARIYQVMDQFFEKFDLLALPVSQVPPFDAELEFPTEINGQQMESYLDWMRSAYFITVTGCPAISLPAGFTAQGWPVGIQLVAAPGQDLKLLQLARSFEQANPAGQRRPLLAV